MLPAQVPQRRLANPARIHSVMTRVWRGPGPLVAGCWLLVALKSAEVLTRYAFPEAVGIAGWDYGSVRQMDGR